MKNCTRCKNVFYGPKYHTMCRICYTPTKKNNTCILATCVTCRNGNYIHHTSHLCKWCTELTPSEQNPEISCSVCKNNFMSKDSKFNRCFSCTFAGLRACTICDKTYSGSSSTKCEECVYKNYPCKVCGNKFSTVPSDKVLRCASCVNAFNSVYNTYRIEFTYEIWTDASWCNSHGVSRLVKSLRNDIDRVTPNCCSGSTDRDNSEYDSYDDTKRTTVVQNYPLTKLITQNDIDSTGKVSVDHKYISLYDNLYEEDSDCNCEVTHTIISTRVYKVPVVNLSDDTA